MLECMSLRLSCLALALGDESREERRDRPSRDSAVSAEAWELSGGEALGGRPPSCRGRQRSCTRGRQGGTPVTKPLVARSVKKYEEIGL